MSNDEQNRFGGGNANALYVPMSDVEQEVLMRLVESQCLRVKVHGWGIPEIVPTLVSYGDKRIQLQFRVPFTAPLVPKPMATMEIEVRTDTGISLHRKQYPTFGGGGHPIEVCAGLDLDMVIDIAIDHMDPALVKMLKPGAFGLTSRRLDRDTGNRTLTGNMKSGSDDREALGGLEKAEAEARALDPMNIAYLRRKGGQ